jgi:hypothetical protein
MNINRPNCIEITLIQKLWFFWVNMKREIYSRLVYSFIILTNTTATVSKFCIHNLSMKNISTCSEVHILFSHLNRHSTCYSVNLINFLRDIVLLGLQYWIKLRMTLCTYHYTECISDLTTFTKTTTVKKWRWLIFSNLFIYKSKPFMLSHT